MPKYKVTFNGKTRSFSADNPEQASIAARLYFAGRGRADEVAEKELEEGGPPERQGALSFMPGQRGAPTSVPVASDEEMAELESGKRQGATAAGQAALLTMTAPALIANPMAALGGLAKSAGGAYLGSEIGQRLGGIAGMPEAGKAIGATAGGLAGPFVGPQQLMKVFGMQGGRGGALGSIFERLAGGTSEAAGKEAAAVAVRKLELEAAKLAEKKAAREAAMAARERALKLAEERNALMRMRIEGRTPPKAKPTVSPAAETPTPSAAKATESTTPAPAGRVAVPASTGIPVPAADTATIVLKLQQQMKTASGRKVVRELLADMPEAQAKEIKALLMRGQAHPATVLGALFDPTKSAVGRVARPGEELARLLGQFP